MTISTIIIGSNTYTVYATRAEVNTILAVDPVRRDAWAALADTDEVRGPFIVSATDRLDLLAWQGSKTGGSPAQFNQWPRTGLFYPDGTSVSTTEAPQELVRATALLSGSIALSAKAAESGSSGSNIKSVKAGSAAVSFFRQQSGKPLQDETAFALIQFWLEGESISASSGSFVSGTDGESSFVDIDQWGRIRGFP